MNLCDGTDNFCKSTNCTIFLVMQRFMDTGDLLSTQIIDSQTSPSLKRLNLDISPQFERNDIAYNNKIYLD